MTHLIPFQIFKQLLATDFLLLMLILQEKCSEIKRHTLAMSLKGHTLAMALKVHTLAMSVKVHTLAMALKGHTLAMALKVHTLAMALKGHTLAMALKGGMATNNCISWSIFTKISTDVRTPKVKTSSLGGQYCTTPSLFCSQYPILGQEVLRIHANLK